MPDHDKIGFGVIGVGFGKGRAELAKAVPGAQLVAVSSRDAAKAEAAAAELGCQGYDDYREMLKRDDIHVIAIYTPSAQHRDIAIEAANAGKHLIVTKPLEITLDRIDAMIAATDANKVKMATEYVVRYEPSNYALYRAVHDGALGKMILGEFAEKLYRPQWYYELDGGWRSRWKTGGGGTVINQGIHTLDQMVWLMGDVASVTAEAGAFASKIESEDTAVVLVKFKSGAVGTFIATTTFHNPKPGGRYGGGTVRRIEINGDKGSGRIDDEALTMLHIDGGADLPRSVTPPAANVFEDMVRWVRDDAYASPSLVKPAASRASMALVLAIYESARDGKTVKL
ncbi:MAG TPA: Gfo/Idh/MocA family oxidoreductase [Devosiaceae bacterium]|jgi:predicted dehydrogenase